MTRRRRSLGFRVAASAVIVVTLGCMAELAARTIGAEVPAWRLVDAEGVVMTGHETRLWGLSPGVKQNGDEKATINTLGLRGEAPAMPKPAGRTRVLVLGDSTWFGHGVPDDRTFPAQLEARLRADGLDVDVINAGIPGYSTEQTRILLDEVGWGLEPDMLLIGSLWSDNNVDSFRDQDLLETARVARENPLFASHFFRLLAGAVDRARGGTGARIVTWTKQSQFPTHGGRRVPLQRYAENLDVMAREAAAKGIGTALIGPCNVGMVDGRYPDGASWEVFFDAQRQVAAHHGVPWIPTLPAMRAAAQDDAERLFVDVMHPSAEGHAVFAATAADALRAAGWPGERLLAKAAPFPADTLSDSRFGEGSPNPASPQRNLFGDVRTAGPPTGPAVPSTDPHDEGSAGGGPRKASPMVGAGAAPSHDRATNGRWTVEGSVTGGTPPLRVELWGPDGRAFSSARLAAPGPFALAVRADLDAVELVVTDAAGVTTRRALARGQAVGTVELE